MTHLLFSFRIHFLLMACLLPNVTRRLCCPLAALSLHASTLEISIFGTEVSPARRLSADLFVPISSLWTVGRREKAPSFLYLGFETEDAVCDLAHGGTRSKWVSLLRTLLVLHFGFLSVGSG